MLYSVLGYKTEKISHSSLADSAYGIKQNEGLKKYVKSRAGFVHFLPTIVEIFELFVTKFNKTIRVIPKFPLQATIQAKSVQLFFCKRLILNQLKTLLTN